MGSVPPNKTYGPKTARQVTVRLNVKSGTVAATLFRDGANEASSGDKSPSQKLWEWSYVSDSDGASHAYTVSVTGNGTFELRFGGGAYYLPGENPSEDADEEAQNADALEEF